MIIDVSQTFRQHHYYIRDRDRYSCVNRENGDENFPSKWRVLLHAPRSIVGYENFVAAVATDFRQNRQPCFQNGVDSVTDYCVLMSLQVCVHAPFLLFFESI